MKKNLLRIVICLLGFVFGLGSYDAKGQWVTIPDSNFVNWLNANGFASCMNGNLMDTTCGPILNKTYLNISDTNITDITGIVYFANLTTLQCDNCHLISLPALPNSINLLTCTHNQLTTISTLPDSLTDFNCSYNELTNIASLPPKLIYFWCIYNNLTNLPSLPNALETLNCSQNLITNLPALPDSLTYFECYNNHLTSLPPLPNNLTHLECSFNPLTSLPNLPNSLIELLCGHDQVTSLPQLPQSLRILRDQYSQLSALPTLPDSIIYLDCSINSITSLPLLPSSLLHLACWQNQLSSLPVLPDSLVYLACSNNQLIVLPQIPNQINTIYCNNNQLTSLPSFPNSLKSIDCAYNQLTGLPDLPDSLYVLYVGNNPNLLCFPELKRIQNLEFSNTGITCIPNYSNVTSSFPSIYSLPLCGLFNTNGCPFYWNISGKVYADSNNNCLNDAGEMGLTNLKIKLNKGGILNQQTYTVNDGFYSFDTDTGTYNYTVDTTGLPVIVTCPISGFQTSVLTVIDSLDYDMNFGMNCKPGFDIGIKSVVRDSGVFRPGNFAKVKFIAGDISSFYGLHCAAGTSGIVQIILAGPISYVGAATGSIIPIVTGDTLLFTVTDFGTINPNSDFRIIVQTDTTAIIGNIICFEVNVTPTIGDIYPLNNSLQQCFNVVNSYDPNEKEVFPQNLLIENIDKLTYTINFQNTGNAPAEHIYILDTLDAAIEESSFELLAYNHQPQVQVIGNLVRFNFPNINLPDSMNDEPASHGYVQYRVKLKDSLALGTVISNTSYIYFDFNAPVQTNTVIDTLTDCNGLASINIINQTFCAGDTLMLDAALVYPAATDWYVDSVFVSSNQSVSVPNLSIGNHEIKLVVSNAYCNTEVVSNVLIHSLPLVDLGNDTSTCNLPVILDAGIGNVSYQWNNGETTQTIIANGTANYSVIVTDTHGCLNADTISIAVNALPVKPTIIQNISLLTSSSAAGNQWLMNGNVIAGAINNTYNVTLTGWYSVMVTDSNGCSNLSDSIYMDLSGVSDVAGTQGGVWIVPNPATDEFRVLGLEFGVGDVVTVTDALGKIVYRVKIGQAGSNLRVETLGFDAGVYFVNVKTNKFTAVLKVVKY